MALKTNALLEVAGVFGGLRSHGVSAETHVFFKAGSLVRTAICSQCGAILEGRFEESGRDQFRV
jgi:hypothetical protein